MAGTLNLHNLHGSIVAAPVHSPRGWGRAVDVNRRQIRWQQISLPPLWHRHPMLFDLPSYAPVDAAAIANLPVSRPVSLTPWWDTSCCEGYLYCQLENFILRTLKT
jgi:hypothetical protein